MYLTPHHIHKPFFFRSVISCLVGILLVFRLFCDWLYRKDLLFWVFLGDEDGKASNGVEGVGSRGGKLAVLNELTELF